ncbi:MAG TPA: transcriptional repressor [Candidatus Dormibacteraeota bacterium]
MARRSPVRDALGLLMQRPDHRAWSIEELLTEVLRTGHRTNPSSILRAIVAMERAGAVQRVDLGDGLQRYEATGEHHEHIQCQRCGSVAEIGGCLLPDTASRVRQLTGFEVTEHRLVLQGLCRECQEHRRAELEQRLADLR